MAIASPRSFAQEPDSFLLVRLGEVEIKDSRKWDNNKERYEFNQTRYYVTKILPYLHEATRLFHDLETKMNEPGISKKERKKYINSREDEVRNRLEPQVKALNETQGVLLIKLISRQTGANIYSILNEFKNPFTAVKWQAWARMNGFSIARKYDPADEPLLEAVMMSLGYPLPAFYERAAGTVSANSK
jgi:hypothetical protein